MIIIYQYVYLPEYKVLPVYVKAFIGICMLYMLSSNMSLEIIVENKVLLYLRDFRAPFRIKYLQETEETFPSHEITFVHHVDFV